MAGAKYVGLFQGLGMSQEEVLATRAVVQAVSAVGVGVGPTLGELEERWLRERKAAGLRGSRTDASRWNTHVASSPLASLPVTAVTRRDVRAWLATMLSKQSIRRRPLSYGSLKYALGALRQVLGMAVEEELIDVNPCLGVTIPRGRKARTDEPWTVLTVAEQTELLNSLRVPERWIVAFALGTGLRQGEQWSLHLEDVHLEVPEGEQPYVDVRFGSEGEPRKGGKPHRVPLFGLGLLAVDSWMMTEGIARTAKCNPEGLLFPAKHGGRRFRGEPQWWQRAVKAAGIKRNVRWHDLRHSCASSLVGGWWGRKWSLEEVRLLLGHAKLQMTERYAHFAHDRLASAARENDRDSDSAIRLVHKSAAAKEALVKKPDDRSNHRSRGRSKTDDFGYHAGAAAARTDDTRHHPDGAADDKSIQARCAGTRTRLAKAGLRVGVTAALLRGQR